MLILWTLGLIGGGWCLSVVIALLLWERVIVSHREAHQAGVSDLDSLLMPRSALWLPLLDLVGLMMLLGWILVRIGLLEAVTVLVCVTIGSLFVSIRSFCRAGVTVSGAIAS